MANQSVQLRPIELEIARLLLEGMMELLREMQAEQTDESAVREDIEDEIANR